MGSASCKDCMKEVDDHEAHGDNILDGLKEDDHARHTTYNHNEREKSVDINEEDFEMKVDGDVGKSFSEDLKLSEKGMQDSGQSLLGMIDLSDIGHENSI